MQVLWLQFYTDMLCVVWLDENYYYIRKVSGKLVCHFNGFHCTYKEIKSVRITASIWNYFLASTYACQSHCIGLRTLQSDRRNSFLVLVWHAFLCCVVTCSASRQCLNTRGNDLSGHVSIALLTGQGSVIVNRLLFH